MPSELVSDERLTLLSGGISGDREKAWMAKELLAARAELATLKAAYERRLGLLRNALENITSTAKEVKTVNTRDFMEHLLYRHQEAEAAWNEDVKEAAESAVRK